MAFSVNPGRYPALLLATGLIGATSLPALAQDTVYVGGTGESVELNLDVLDSLGSPPTVPGLLRFDIQQGQAASGMPLPLPGEANAAVSSATPLPPPSRSSQSRRVTAGTPALPTVTAPAAPAPRPAASETTSSGATASATGRAALPTRVAGPVPSAPKAAVTPEPKIAAPAQVSIPAPAPEVPASRSTQTTVDIPAPPTSVTATRAATPPAAPKVSAPAITAPATTAPAITAPAITAPKVTAPPAPAAKQETQVATAAPATAAKPGSKDNVRIPFETSSKTLPGEASAKLDQVAKLMAADDALRAQLLAYASDADGRSSADARRLSLSRGLAVRSYLIGKGIASTRMDVRILGNKVSGEPRDRVDLTLVTR